MVLLSGENEGGIADPRWLHAESTAGTGGNFRGAQPSALSTELARPWASPIPFPDLSNLFGGGGGGGDNGSKWASKWLLGLAALGIGVTAAPVAYKAFVGSRKGKRAQKAQDVGESLDFASTRATSLLTSIMPYAAFPIAYITVEALEEKGYIKGELGDTVQTLMAVAMSAGFVQGVGSAIGWALKAVR